MTMGTRSVSKAVRGICLGAPGNATIILLALVTFFWGCDRSEDEIKVYRLVKPSGESEPIGKDAIASTNAPVKSTLERVPTPTGDVPVPANWEPQPLSEMRQASFLVKGENGAVADISVVKLGPAARQRARQREPLAGQLGQSPVTPEKLTGMIQKLPTARGEMDVVDLNGKPEDGDAKGRPDYGSDRIGRRHESFFKMRGKSHTGRRRKRKVSEMDRRHAHRCRQRINPDAASGPAKLKQATDQMGRSARLYAQPASPCATPVSPPRATTLTSPSSLSPATVAMISATSIAGGNNSVFPRLTRASYIVPLKTNETTFSTIDIPGANTRTVAAWTRKDGRAWFSN